MIRQKIIGNWPVLLCILLFGINVCIYRPGFSSPDTIDQYRQALTGKYGDWHPPFMAYWWHFLLKLHKGTGLMLCFQLGLLWSAAAILALAMKRTLTKLAVIFLACSPIVQNFAGYLIKDVQMAYSWLFAFAVMYYLYASGRKMKPGHIIIVLLALLYGTAVRINALPGVLPLLYFFVACLYPSSGVKKRMLGAAGICVAMLCFIVAFQKWVIKPEQDHPEVKLYLQDLSGIYVRTGDNVFPAFLQKDTSFDVSYIAAHYSTATFDHIWWNPENKNVTQGYDDIPALQKAWVSGIKAHPGAYLHNRLSGFLYFLRIKKREHIDLTYYWYFTQPSEFNFRHPENRALRLLEEGIRKQADKLYMEPWFWLLLNVVLLIPLWWLKDRHRRMVVVLLLLSPLFYLLPQFFIYQIDTDFRYFYWNCIAVSLAAILLVNRERSMVNFVKRQK